MASPSLFCLLLSLVISATFILTSCFETITIDLVRVPKHHSSKNPKEIISNLAESTLGRAYHMKQLHKHSLSTSTSTTPLFARSAADYSFKLSIGTPPQEIPVPYDTGSSLVWVPCTTNYECKNCTRNNAPITIYKPKKSSSKHSLKCYDEKCRWLDLDNYLSGCPPKCSPRTGCSRPCPYIHFYGIWGNGVTIGQAIYENLNLGKNVVRNFVVGCSRTSEKIPEGIAGFGRSPRSLPNQLNLNKFSQCLISHSKFDDTSKSSKLILGGNLGETVGMKYTPFVKTPPKSQYEMSPYSEYYYVQLEKVTVGKKTVKVPLKIVVPSKKGNGGTVIDSGTTLTLLSSTVFDPIVKAFYTQMTRAQQKRVELVTVSAAGSDGDVLCINVSGGLKRLFPKIVFVFHGGVEVDLPVANYVHVGEDVLCLPFVNATENYFQGLGWWGPTIIFGNYQQQNFLIEYDLKNERLGVKRQTCG